MKKVYRVWARSIGYCYIDIEAESAEKAQELADECVDGGDFHDDGIGGWEWGSVAEMEDVEPDYTQEELEGD